MVWTGVALSAFISLVSFLVPIRNFNRANPYSGALCDLYLLEHMLPDGHPFEFMYKGLPRTRLFPRLFWPCIATFLSVGLTLASIAIASVLTANGVLGNGTPDTVFFLSSIGSTFVANVGPLAIPAIQNKICFRKMMKMDFPSVFQIRADIEKKWPGFFDY